LHRAWQPASTNEMLARIRSALKMQSCHVVKEYGQEMQVYWKDCEGPVNVPVRVLDMDLCCCYEVSVRELVRMETFVIVLSMNCCVHCEYCCNVSLKSWGRIKCVWCFEGGHSKIG